MWRRVSTNLFIGLLLIITIVTGYNYFSKPFGSDDSRTQQVSTPPPSINPTPSPLDPSQLLSELTLDEKINRVLVLPFSTNETEQATSTASVATRSAELAHAGGYMLMGTEVAEPQFKQLVAEQGVQEPYPASYGGLLRPLLLVDHEGGDVQRLNGDGYTHLPSWHDLCQMVPEDRRALLTQSAKELQASGVSVVLAPMLDRASSTSVLGERVCSADSTIVAEAASDFIMVFRQYGIMPVIKHFPGIGSARYDLHNRFASIAIDPEDVALFKLVLNRFPEVPVMVSHVGVANQFANIPCSISPACVEELLAVFPDRLLITDALDMAAVRSASGSAAKRSLDEVAVDAVAAGNTLIMLGERVAPDELVLVQQSLKREYLTNASFAIRIDEAVRKIIHLQIALAGARSSYEANQE
ncbi:glycoside hydrolase family 3 protein [Candidatus Woesebacteria bacterium]|nr:glycoside hydrolase family 3 protein [Candidatus Woesebacteria bacterium]